jgi:hypothetical protein
VPELAFEGCEIIMQQVENLFSVNSGRGAQCWFSFSSYESS